MATNNSNGKSNKRSNFIILTVQASNDGEAKVSQSGKAWASLRAFYSQGKDKKTDQFLPSIWFNVKAFGKDDQVTGVVGAVANTAKGDKITVKGRLSMEEWTDKDGNPRQTYVLTASSIEPFVPTAEAADEELDGEPA
jgi:single-stranded DNA-binding protein